MRVAFFAPRYNIAPRQQAPVFLRENGQTVARLMRWGLIPSWSKDESIGDRLINARAETLTEKSSFRKPFASQRCLIPADGYYEWQAEVRPPVVETVVESSLRLESVDASILRSDIAEGGQRRHESIGAQRQRYTGKKPFRFTMKDGGPFCFAGLWEKWVRPPDAQEFLIDDLGDAPQPSRVIETFTIITTTPNQIAASIHDRMPVILSPDHYGWWLDERRPGSDLKILLRPCPAEDMTCYRVSPLVNNARNDSPECIRPG